MGLKSRIAVAMGLILTLIMFQNCGQMTSSHSTDSSINQLDDEGGRKPFAQGDTYDPSLIPFLIEDPVTLAAVENYPSRTGFKAMAFTAEGNLYISSSNDSRIEDQVDWDQATLERCQLFFMNKPCALFASGNLIAQGDDTFFEDFESKIILNPRFAEGVVPGALNFWQNYYITSYPASTATYKAYALTHNGAAHSGWSQISQDEANRRALEFCESITDVPCTLYAIDLDVVFDLDTYQWEAKRLQWGVRPFLIDEIPFIDDNLRETLRNQYTQAQQAGEHFALALDRYGFYESLRSATPITQANLDTIRENCNAKLPAPTIADQYQRQCFIYSVDNQAIITLEDFRRLAMGR